MRLFGLIGYPLGHSFSRNYFTQKFKADSITDAEYRNFEIQDISDVSGILRIENLIGLNVTIPYKSSILNFADILSEEVAEIGAANTIKKTDSRIHAFNTDYTGFQKSLTDLPYDQSKKALVLGSGGSSKAIQYALRNMKLSVDVVSRNPVDGQLSYHDLRQSGLDAYSLIVNTTPQGMKPHIGSFPDIPYNQINSNHFCYDLVYNPETTLFLIKAAVQGAGIKNGLEMLILQAEASWTIWSEVR